MNLHSYVAATLIASQVFALPSFSFSAVTNDSARQIKVSKKTALDFIAEARKKNPKLNTEIEQKVFQRHVDNLARSPEQLKARLIKLYEDRYSAGFDANSVEGALIVGEILDIGLLNRTLDVPVPIEEGGLEEEKTEKKSVSVVAWDEFFDEGGKGYNHQFSEHDFLAEHSMGVLTCSGAIVLTIAFFIVQARGQTGVNWSITEEAATLSAGIAILDLFFIVNCFKEIFGEGN